MTSGSLSSGPCLKSVPAGVADGNGDALGRGVAAALGKGVGVAVAAGVNTGDGVGAGSAAALGSSPVDGEGVAGCVAILVPTYAISKLQVWLGSLIRKDDHHYL